MYYKYPFDKFKLMKTRLRRRKLIEVVDLTDDMDRNFKNVEEISPPIELRKIRKYSRKDNFNKSSYVSSENSASGISKSKSIYNNGNNIYLRNKSKRENNLYEAEAIVGKKVNKKGKTLYKVKWRDAPDDKSTWESESNFAEVDKNLIEEYERKGKFNMEKSSNISSNMSYRKSSSDFEIQEIVLDDSSSDMEIDSYSKESSSSDSSYTSPKKSRRSHYSNISRHSSFNSYSDSSERKSSSSDFDSYSKISKNSKISKINRYSKNSKISKNSRYPSLNGINVSDNYNNSSSYIKFLKGDINTDKIKKIVSAKIIKPEKRELSCLVEFETRPDGNTPDQRKYSSKVLRSHPNGHIPLIDFLLSRLSVNKYN